MSYPSFPINYAPEKVSLYEREASHFKNTMDKFRYICLQRKTCVNTHAKESQHINLRDDMSEGRNEGKKDATSLV